MIYHFSVFFHISAQDSFQRTEKSFECVSVNPNQSARSSCLDTGLSNGVSHQCNFSEIFTCFVLENFLDRPAALFFFSNAFSFCNDIELISIFALFHNILVWSKALFSQGVTDLFSFIAIHI